MTRIEVVLMVSLAMVACGAPASMAPPPVVTTALLQTTGPQPPPPPPPRSVADDEACSLLCWPLSPSRASRILERTLILTSSGIYVSGEPSPQVAAFNVLLDQPDSEARFKKLATSGNLVAQLYALSGLQVLGSPDERNVAARLRLERGTVFTQFGCIGGDDPVSTIVDVVERNAFGRQLRERREGVYMYYERLASGHAEWKGVCGHRRPMQCPEERGSSDEAG